MFPSIRELKEEAASTADECPGCDHSPSAGDMSHAESYDEDYISCRCPNCQKWQYNHTGREWIKLTPPGEENPTVYRD